MAEAEVRRARSPNQNEKVIRRFFEEVWNEGKLDAAHEMIAAEAVTNQLVESRWRRYPRGPDEIAHHVAEWREAVPDVETTVESVVAEDDRVALLLTIRGTLRGTHPWFGTPPTNELITVTGAAFYRLRDGKIVEDWVVLDQLGHLMELGLVPPSNELIP